MSISINTRTALWVPGSNAIPTMQHATWRSCNASWEVHSQPGRTGNTLWNGCAVYHHAFRVLMSNWFVMEWVNERRENEVGLSINERGENEVAWARVEWGWFIECGNACHGVEWITMYGYWHKRSSSGNFLAEYGRLRNLISLEWLGRLLPHYYKFLCNGMG